MRALLFAVIAASCPRAPDNPFQGRRDPLVIVPVEMVLRIATGRPPPFRPFAGIAALVDRLEEARNVVFVDNPARAGLAIQWAISFRRPPTKITGFPTAKMPAACSGRPAPASWC
jgi:hypothetical protein